MTAVTVIRNLLPLPCIFAMTQWQEAMGVANVMNILNAFTIVILSFAGIFIWKGKQWRARTAKVYEVYARRQFVSRAL